MLSLFRRNDCLASKYRKTSESNLIAKLNSMQIMQQIDTTAKSGKYSVEFCYQDEEYRNVIREMRNLGFQVSEKDNVQCVSWAPVTRQQMREMASTIVETIANLKDNTPDMEREALSCHATPFWEQPDPWNIQSPPALRLSLSEDVLELPEDVLRSPSDASGPSRRMPDFDSELDNLAVPYCNRAHYDDENDDIREVPYGVTLYDGKQLHDDNAIKHTGSDDSGSAIMVNSVDGSS